jgi:hypothetical protein
LKERYAVSNDNVVNLIQPGILIDQLTDVLRNGARILLIQALEAEVSEFLAGAADLKTLAGGRRAITHPHFRVPIEGSAPGFCVPLATDSDL